MPKINLGMILNILNLNENLRIFQQPTKTNNFSHLSTKYHVSVLIISDPFIPHFGYIYIYMYIYVLSPSKEESIYHVK